MPSLDAFAKFGKLQFCFDYNQIIKQTDFFLDTSEQIEYLLFVITEAKRVINIFNLYEDGIINREKIFEIKPVLETGFLAVLNKFADKKLKLIKSTPYKNQLELIFDIESEYYKYIDQVKAAITLLEVELNYRRNLAINRLTKPEYPQQQEELFVKEKELIPKIKWLRTETELLKLFSLLNNNRSIDKYENTEILDHFIIYNSGNRISMFCPSDNKFQWLGSDNEFCFLINQLVKKKIIPSHKKYKIISHHFINREGSEFIYLAQKHNFTKNYLQSKTVIIDLVDQLDI